MMNIFSYFFKYKDAQSFPFKSEQGFRRYVITNDLFTLNAIGRRIVDEQQMCLHLGIEVKHD